MWNVKQNSCFGLRFRFLLGSCNTVPLHQPVEVEVLEEHSTKLETCVLSMVLVLSQKVHRIWFTLLTLKAR